MVESQELDCGQNGQVCEETHGQSDRRKMQEFNPNHETRENDDQSSAHTTEDGQEEATGRPSPVSEEGQAKCADGVQAGDGGGKGHRAAIDLIMKDGRRGDEDIGEEAEGENKQGEERPRLQGAQDFDPEESLDAERTK
jgi:hypothetical protein